MSAGCKDMPLDEALNIVDPDSHTRANPDMPIQEQKETFLKACRVVCAAVRRAEPENKPHGLQTTWDTPDRCSYCGEHLAKEWNYCPECGKPTDLILPDNLEKPLVIRELAADYLKICENKCGGNLSTGIQPCRYWVMPDIDSDGKPIPGYCKLETYVTRKNDEK